MAFFVACVAWFVAIFASTDPQVRMDRTCLPVEYSGRVGTSSMMLIKADWAAPTHEFFEGVNYGCKFVLWRMFYEESWNSAQPATQAPAAALTSNTSSNQLVSVANAKGSSADPVAAASAPAAGSPKLSSK
jgi:hypothetical protein